ncbi:hypothetical protein RND81_02G151900 [Saponaria officinalis]|uniref:Uncharacterized protein n=1 Tax=Saponaria officinalis TaxID=3572 RepID=A0AAW1MLR5_SAPOF
MKENNDPFTGDGSVDFKGNPALKSKTGNWRACPFILGTECCERLAFFGIFLNLVTYLTQKMHEGNVSAARNVNIWTGTCSLTPLIGAFLADAYWGRYRTIAIFSLIYVIGMCILTLSASVPAFKPAECVGSVCPSATQGQYALLFGGLYLIAIGTGGIKPCVSTLGAGQFDETDPYETAKKGSFFNWFYFSLSIGSLVASTFIVWIQENVRWGLGFGIPALFMGIAAVSFLSGTFMYRFQRPGGSPSTRICQVIVASLLKRKLEVPRDVGLLYEIPDQHSAIAGSRKLEHTEELMYLDKACVLSDSEKTGAIPSDPWKLCTVTQVEELKILIRMLPIWATGFIYSAVYIQMSTIFVEQGTVMDRTLGSFTIPAASLSTFLTLSVLILVPLYDKLLVPLARRFTNRRKGISELQRMGIGLLISVLPMVCAALVEIRRLHLAKEHGLIDKPIPAPLSIFWQIPQYLFLGIADVFTYVGQLEFFYDQSPDAMRSLGTALCLLETTVGSYVSSLILTVVTSVTTGGGKPGWIPDNLNKGKLYNYFWLWAALSFLNLLLYILFALRYKQKKAL